MGEDTKPLDLSELRNFQFQTEWGRGDLLHSGGASSTSRYSRDREDYEHNREPRDARNRSDRRERPHRPSDRAPQRSGQGSPQRKSFGRSSPGDKDSRASSGMRPARDSEGHYRGRAADGNTSRPFFQKPPFDVFFYPEDNALRLLAAALKQSHTTYRLIDLATLILQKPERFTVVLRIPVASSQESLKPSTPSLEAQPANDRPAAAKSPFLFVCNKDGAPFETESQALEHFIKQHLDSLFEIDSVETEAPKGTFTMVSKCGMTGLILGPPNYHLYSSLLKKHHSSQLAQVPYPRFLAALETVRDPQSIQAWVDSMKQTVRYTLREPRAEEPTALESLDQVRAFLLTKRKREVLSAVRLVRLAGTALEGLPQGRLREVIEGALAQQRKFPILTASLLKSPLRRQKFCLFRDGKVLLVSAAKPKSADQANDLAEGFKKLYQFVQTHPSSTWNETPFLFLGLPVPQKTAGSASSGQVDQASTEESTPGNLLSAEQNQSLAAVQRDLNWLIAEGYLLKYENGQLEVFKDTMVISEVPPPPAKKKNQGTRETKTGAVQSSPKPAETPEETLAASVPEGMSEGEQEQEAEEITAETPVNP